MNPLQHPIEPISGPWTALLDKNWVPKDTLFPTLKSSGGYREASHIRARKPERARQAGHIDITWWGGEFSVKVSELARISPIRVIKEALASGDVERARQVLAQALSIKPEDETLQRLSRLAAPPRVVAVRSKPSGIDHEANRRWMREHAHRYPGKWVAVRDGQLLSAAPSISKLRAEVGDTKGILVTKLV